MNITSPTLLVPELGRIDACQAARILGFPDSDLPVLIRAKLLRPLANPGPTSPRFFAATEIRQLAASRDWLDKAQRAVSQHNQRRNSRRAHGSSRASSRAKTWFKKTQNLGPSTNLLQAH